MLNLWHALQGWFEAALAGMGTPFVIALALALTTLLLEDLAIAAGVALAAKGLISWELSLVAVAAGIAIGDLGLYALGLGARRMAWLRRRYGGSRADWARDKLHDQLGTAVLLARAIPGLRLATYTACGFVRVALLPFTLWVLLAVTLWTAGLFALSAAIGHALAEALGLPLPLAVALPVIALALVFPLMRWLRRARPAVDAAQPPHVKP
jgi:membrane protein DedA with SNARE-associated domain